MQTAVNPDTGETVVFTDGAWQKAESVAANQRGEKAFLVGGKWLSDTVQPSAPTMQNTPSTPSEVPQKPSSIKEFMAPYGIGEAGASLASGAVATPVAGLAGLGQAAANAIGLGTTSPADRVKSVAQAMTFQPKTEIGKGVASAVSYPFEKLAEGADIAGSAVAESTGSPALGAGVNAAIQTAVPYGAAKAASAIKGMAKPIPEEVLKAREAGIAVTPSEGSGGFISKTLESLSGEPRLAKKMSVQNQPAIKDLIAKDVGLPTGVELTRDAIYDRITDAGKAYEVVRRSGRVISDQKYKQDLGDVAKDYRIAAKDFPDDANPIIKLVDSADQASFDANSAMSKIITLRKAAKSAFSKQEPELGRATIDIANALEEQIGRHLSARAQTNPSLAPALKDFQDARVSIAKGYAAIKALNDATGDINPQAYAKMLQKNVPLSGEAKTVGELAEAFPRSMQNTAGRKSTGPTLFDAFAAGVSQNVPLLFARPITRSVLSSTPYQAMMARQNPLGSLAKLQANPAVLAGEYGAEQRGVLEELYRQQQQ